MNRLSFLLFGFAAVLFSCGEDEKPAYSFKNQDLSGKIGNTEWTYTDGYAEIYGTGDDSQISVDLFQQAEGEGCSAFPIGNEVFFSMPNKVGVYKLKLDLDNFESSKIVTLYEEEGSVNNLASTGAVEITSISDTQVTGKIDARLDGENFVNGNFSVSICQ